MLYYLRARYWEQEVASKWLKAVDNKTYQAYKTRCDEIYDAGELDILFQGLETCYLGSSLLINIAVQPHKDIEDVSRGWVGTNNWGQYEGAYAIFHELGIKVPQRPGTTILSRSAVSAHSISVIESGFRFSRIWYFKTAVLDPSLAKNRSDEDEDDFLPPDKKSPDVSQNDGPARRSDRERAAP